MDTHRSDAIGYTYHERNNNYITWYTSVSLLLNNLPFTLISTTHMTHTLSFQAEHGLKNINQNERISLYTIHLKLNFNHDVTHMKTQMSMPQWLPMWATRGRGEFFSGVFKWGPGGYASSGVNTNGTEQTRSEVKCWAVSRACMQQASLSETAWNRNELNARLRWCVRLLSWIVAQKSLFSVMKNWTKM